MKPSDFRCHITIPERIRLFREEKGLSQNAFGKLIGVSGQAVWKWEQGVCLPDISFLPRLAQILGCRTDDFFETKSATAER